MLKDAAQELKMAKSQKIRGHFLSQRCLPKVVVLQQLVKPHQQKVLLPRRKRKRRQPKVKVITLQKLMRRLQRKKPQRRPKHSNESGKIFDLP